MAASSLVPLLVLLLLLWGALLLSVLRPAATPSLTHAAPLSLSNSLTHSSTASASASSRSRGVRGFFGGVSSLVSAQASGAPPKLSALPYYSPTHSLTHFRDPPPLEEIRHNITEYLSTLHSRLGALAGPRATGLRIWETFLDVTVHSILQWDEQNQQRFPTPRHDNSIFVSVGTYRDEYCPMTLKSLYSQAEFPEKIFVGLFQQNCFEETCTTGVLQNGAIEETGTDVNCYDVFCESKEGIASGACVDNRVRLFNVNESESLGPYMARYFGAKFYRGEEFYLQIDSHSEFVSHWDTKLIHMISKAPAEKPVISTYPPGADGRWQDSVGNKICDSSFAASQIEWQIVRLDPSQPIAGRPSEPVYAPFVAAGFFFSRGQFLHDVPFDPLLPWIFMVRYCYYYYYYYFRIKKYNKLVFYSLWCIG
jgi:[Skp1-protein]-hydroxyproline N-acetylglucosaminyltransferase